MAQIIPVKMSYHCFNSVKLTLMHKVASYNLALITSTVEKEVQYTDGARLLSLNTAMVLRDWVLIYNIIIATYNYN